VHRGAEEREAMVQCVSRTREWDGLMHSHVPGSSKTQGRGGEGLGPSMTKSEMYRSIRSALSRKNTRSASCIQGRIHALVHLPLVPSHAPLPFLVIGVPPSAVHLAEDFITGMEGYLEWHPVWHSTDPSPHPRLVDAWVDVSAPSESEEAPSSVFPLCACSTTLHRANLPARRKTLSCGSGKRWIGDSLAPARASSAVDKTPDERLQHAFGGQAWNMTTLLDVLCLTNPQNFKGPRGTKPETPPQGRGSRRRDSSSRPTRRITPCGRGSCSFTRALVSSTSMP
jgi:hypothetical protein